MHPWRLKNIQKLHLRMEEIHHLARERIDMASEKLKTRYDARKTGHDFHGGDKVWLWNPKRRKVLSPKLQTNWEGRYTILKRLNDVMMRIQKSPHTKPKPPGQPKGVVVHYTQHPVREQPLSSQSSQKTENFPPRRSTVATPPGFHRPTNRRHATQQKENPPSRHAPHQRLVLIWD
ncbi:kinectin [Trichonephila clavipes]|nr:kinectin [Trichonephila clavipes]